MILCPVMMVWWLSDFLGGGAMACVRAAQATGYSADSPVAAAALVWSLASAPFYVVLQLSDEVRRAASAKFASNVQQLEQKL